MERMTVKKFDSLKPTDFKNGAILDDIRFSLRRLEELESLHGEKEQPPAGLFHGPGLPSKEPPPDVWESWFQRIPDQYDYPYWTDWAKAIQQWFMEIPCRRKP
jgi:hypothetical protein